MSTASQTTSDTVYGKYLGKPTRHGGKTRRTILTVSLAALLLLVAALAGSAGCTNPYVPAGHEGYVFERSRLFGQGGYKGSVAGPGNYGLSLWRNEVTNIDIRPQTYTEPFQILAKDDLNISFDFHVVMSVDPGHVKLVVEKFGGNEWYERFAQKPLRTFIRESVQNYNSRDLKAQRTVVATEVEHELEIYLEGKPFNLISLVVGNIDYPEVVARAVEKKLAAEQLLEEKETQKAIARKDAEIRIEEAKGIAEAQRIINATLTENYLQHEAINAQLEMAQSPNHTTVYIPAGANGIPLVHVSDE